MKMHARAMPVLADQIYEAFMAASPMPGRIVPLDTQPASLRQAWNAAATAALRIALGLPTIDERIAGAPDGDPPERLYAAFRTKHSARPWKELGADEKRRWRAAWTTVEDWVASLVAAALLEHLRGLKKENTDGEVP